MIDERMHPQENIVGIIVTARASEHTVGDLALQLESVALVSYGRTLVSELSGEFRTAQLIEIAGPNGSGKSTLLAALAGLRQVDRGRIRWRGNAILTGGIHYGPQYPLLFGNLSILENIALIARERVAAVRRRMDGDQALQGIGVLAKVLPPFNASASGLSLGQQRVLLLLAAYASDASVILLDEPFAGLGVSLRAAAVTVLDDLLARGKLVVLTLPT